MSDWHFFDNATELVACALDSQSLTNPSLKVDYVNKIVYRNHVNADHVAVISGGGSGHEPAFTCLVGQGFLTASVAGTIFASPSTEQILNAIVRCSETSKGVLAIVMNYTGDVLNFGVAVEKARTMGIDVDMVVVGRSKGGKVGRRGIAGTVLVQKMPALSLLKEEAFKTSQLLAYVHVSGRSDTSHNTTEVNKGDAELGMGIHSETGSSFEKADIAGLVKKKKLKQLLEIDDKDRAFLQVSAPIVLMLNNLGGVSVLELGAITAIVGQYLASDYSICPVRVLSGTYMTSLNGVGFSITLLNLEASSSYDLWELLDAPVQKGAEHPDQDEEKPQMRKLTLIENAADVGTYDAVLATNALVSGLRRLVKAEPEITRYDTVVGEGDCGIGLKTGAEAVLHHVMDQPLVGSAALDLASILPKIENSMDRTSGALFAIFLNALLHAF
ncbi:dihydroxyacetone kinase [Fusarium circinatum]|uniref:Dihydroxyacetone kinase n=1 Tax=Fusarium circinatum TaxID=48490 RepID=A0A8H5TWF9_FUSCI|nr:dihydroxyacetone kinase [Fusarium circinatum]